METKKQPLAGIVVLDFTQFLSGPFCTMQLSDLGAEVIKVERPDRALGAGPYVKGERTYDLSIMRGKKSITLNLKDPAELAMCLDLAKRVDIIVENFKPGTMARMGLGYEDIHKINPRIIYASISGFGQTGPYSKRGALDVVIQGMSGFMSITGERNGRPMKAGPSIADLVSGLYAFGAVQTALYNRERTGEGQHIDIGMMDCMYSCLDNAVVNYFATGNITQRNGTRHQINTPFQSYRAKDGDVIFAINRDPAYQRFCKALGREDLAVDERFIKAEDRRKYTDEMEVEIEKTTTQYTVDEIEEIMLKHDIPFGRINDIAQVSADPHILHRGMVVEAQHPHCGPYKMAGNPLHFSSIEVVANRPAPMLGQHNEEVFARFFGMDKTQVEEFLAQQKINVAANKKKKDDDE